MDNHREFATSGILSSDYKRKQDDQWEELTRALNELGNQKTSDQWKKVNKMLFYFHNLSTYYNS